MKAADLEVRPCDLGQVRGFIEKHHYSHSVNGVRVTNCFVVVHENRMVGGVIYGGMATTAWRKFGATEAEVLELRRLVLIDGCPKNSESRVIGWTLRWIKRNLPKIRTVVSYADPAQGHSGIIYRAANFEYLGQTAESVTLSDPDTGKTYHPRALRNKYKGDFKPFALALRAKQADGRLVVTKSPGKHCFVYHFERDLL